MISKIKKPVSILLSLIMVFSMFTIVPFPASAAFWYQDLTPGTLILPGDTFSFEDIGSFKFADYNDPTIIHEVKGSDFSYNQATLSVTDGYYSFGSTKLLPTSVSPGGLLIADYNSTTKMATFGVQNITHSFDETTGTLTIGGSGVVPRYFAFTGGDVGDVIFTQSNLVKHLIIDATDMIAIKQDAFMAYTGGCVLEDVEINSTSSTPLIIEENAFFYESGNTVTITVNAATLPTVTSCPVGNYGSPVNLIYNVQEPITFNQRVLSRFYGNLTVTIPTGSKVYIPAAPQFTDSALQNEYNHSAQYGDEWFFWDQHPDLVEGTDYVMGEAGYETLTPENVSLVVGSHTAYFSTYAVTDASVNGAVTASVGGTDVTEAEPDSTVLLTVAPDSGYQFKSITAFGAKYGVEEFSDLVALMGDAVFEAAEYADHTEHTCKAEDGKFVVYNGTTPVTELSESDITDVSGISGNSPRITCGNISWYFGVSDGKITYITAVNTSSWDYLFESADGSESTGTLPPADFALTTVTEGSQYSFTMPKRAVTVTAVFEEIPAPANVPVTGLTLSPSEDQTILVNNTVTFTATVEPADATDKTVVWSVYPTDKVKLYEDADCTTEVGTEATNVLTVYAKGLSAGSATIYVESNADDSQWDRCGVKVFAGIVDMSELQVGDAITSGVMITNESGYKLKLPSGKIYCEDYSSSPRYRGILDHDVLLTSFSFESSYGICVKDNSADRVTYYPIDEYGYGGGDTFVVTAVDPDTHTVTIETPTKYHVYWVNYNGISLGWEYDQYILEGETPSYTGPDPIKPADAQYVYTFSGWSPELAPVTADVTYTAQFTAAPLPADYESPALSGLWVGDSAEVTAAGEINGTGGNGTATVSQEGDYTVLTLDNFSYVGEGHNDNDSHAPNASPIYYNGVYPLIVRLIGTNALTQDGVTSGNSWGFYSFRQVDVRLEGSGALTVSSGNAGSNTSGMRLGGSLTLSECTVTATGGSSQYYYATNAGVDIEADLTIENGAHLTAIAGTVVGDNPLSNGICGAGNNLILRAGAVCATGDTSAIYYGSPDFRTTLVIPSGSTLKELKAGDTEGDAVDTVLEAVSDQKYLYIEVERAAAPTTYTVTWNNYDGSNLETDTGVAAGAAPSYDSDTPAKPADEGCAYTFAGWDDGTTTYGLTDTLPAVTGDVIYTAVFTAVPFVASVTDGGLTTCYTNLSNALQSWMNNTTLTLLANVETTDVIETDKTKTLDLNGHGIVYVGEDPNDSILKVTGGTLTVKDSGSGSNKVYIDDEGRGALSGSGEGVTVSGFLTGGVSGGVFVSAGTLILESGTILGNLKSGGVGGGGVRVNNGAAFQMTGGLITRNTSFGSGGGVGVCANEKRQGSFTMTGGQITANVAHNNGAGVIFQSGAGFQIGGTARITGNRSNDEAHTPNNVWLPQNMTISVVEALDSSASFGVTMASGTGTFTSGLSGKGSASNFTSDDAAYVVALNDSGEAKLMELPSFTGETLTLAGDAGLDVNFYVSSGDMEAADLTVEYTVRGETTRVSMASLEPVPGQGYKLPVSMPAKEMNDKIPVQIKQGDTVLSAIEYAAADYARSICAASDADLMAWIGGSATQQKVDNLRELCRAMLVYGAKAQALFDYNTGNLATAGVDDTLTALDETEFNGLAARPNINTCGLSYRGGTLVLLSETSYRLYFTGTPEEGFAAALEYAPEGVECRIGTKGQYTYVEIYNIPAAEILSNFSLTLGVKQSGSFTSSQTYTVNPGAYIRAVLEDNFSTQAEIDVVTAIYRYCEAAQAYFG